MAPKSPSLHYRLLCVDASLHSASCYSGAESEEAACRPHSAGAAVERSGRGEEQRRADELPLTSPAASGGVKQQRWSGGHPSAPLTLSLARAGERRREKALKSAAPAGARGGLTPVDMKRPGVTRRRRERDGVKHRGRKSRLAAGGRPSVTAAAAVIWLNTGNKSRRQAGGGGRARERRASSRASADRGKFVCARNAWVRFLKSIYLHVMLKKRKPSPRDERD